MGTILICFLVGLLILLGQYHIVVNKIKVNNVIPILINIGFYAGFVEELIFRGAFFSGLYKKTGAFIAATFTSLVYAAVHFVRYPDLITDSSIGWLTGIQMMPDAFRRFHEWAIADYFLTLFIFGVLLSLLRLKHKNIAACIGAHAGVVMLIKIADYFTNRGSNSDFDYLVSPYNSTFGWLSFFVILLFTIFYFIKIKTKRRSY